VEESLDKGPFIATNGDILTGLDLTKIIEAHQGSDALATITLTSVEDSTAYGLVEADHQLRVQRFVEKPGSDEVNTSLINAGIYVLEREVLSMIPQGQETSLEREIFPELQAMGKLHAYISSSYWRDIGTPRSYLAASHDVLSGAIGRDNEFRHTSIDRSARISKGVTLLPPVCIAEDCEKFNCRSQRHNPEQRRRARLLSTRRRLRRGRSKRLGSWGPRKPRHLPSEWECELLMQELNWV